MAVSFLIYYMILSYMTLAINTKLFFSLTIAWTSTARFPSAPRGVKEKKKKNRKYIIKAEGEKMKSAKDGLGEKGSRGKFSSLASRNRDWSGVTALPTNRHELFRQVDVQTNTRGPLRWMAEREERGKVCDKMGDGRPLLLKDREQGWGREGDR